MTVVSWNPLAEMDDLFRRSLRPQYGRPAPGEKVAETDFVPPVDIRETAAAYEIDVELPGVEPSDVSVDLQEGILTVRGERRRGELPKGVKVRRSELQWGRFARAFVLPEDADPDEIRARAHQGVLKITVSKRPEVQPRSISIDVH